MQEMRQNPYAPPDSEPQRAAGPTNWRSSTGLSITIVTVSCWIVFATVVDKPSDAMPLDQILAIFVVGPAIGGAIGLVKRSCLIPGTVLGATIIGLFLALCMEVGIQNLHKVEVSRKAIEHLGSISVALFIWGIVFGATVLIVRIVISFIARRVRRVIAPQ